MWIYIWYDRILYITKNHRFVRLDDDWRTSEIELLSLSPFYWALLAVYISFRAPRCNMLRNLAFFVVIATLTSFKRSAVKGQRSIYTKVSLPWQVRFQRGNVTKIELAPFLPGPGPRFAISDSPSCPDGLMPRKIEDPRLRKLDSLRHRSKTRFSCSFDVICPILTAFRESIEQFSFSIFLQNSRYISHDRARNKTIKRW